MGAIVAVCIVGRSRPSVMLVVVVILRTGVGVGGGSSGSIVGAT